MAPTRSVGRLLVLAVAPMNGDFGCCREAYEWRFLPLASGFWVLVGGVAELGNTMPIHRGIVSRTGAVGGMNGLVVTQPVWRGLLGTAPPF